MHRRQRNLELRCYPRDDREFLADAQRTVAECRETTSMAERMLAEVQRKLRERYPRARIEPRQPIADLGEASDEVWYCYRDGGLVA